MARADPTPTVVLSVVVVSDGALLALSAAPRKGHHPHSGVGMLWL